MSGLDLEAIRARAQKGIDGLVSEGGGPSADANPSLEEDIPALIAEVEALRAEVERLKAECASISAEFGLPPTIRPAEGEISRMRREWKESRSALATARHDALEEARHIFDNWTRDGFDVSKSTLRNGVFQAIDRALASSDEGKTEE